MLSTNQAEQFKVSHVKIWIINNQLARRNLTDTEFTYFIGKMYESEKHALGENQYTMEGVEQNVLPESTAEKIADQFKVTHMTVKRAEQLSEAVDKLEETLGGF